jgi:protoheme IX farnesyltransferase
MEQPMQTPSYTTLPRTWLAPLLALKKLVVRLASYWLLIKDLQTGLLVLTAGAGYVSACCANWRAGSLWGLIGSLFLAVSGSTVLNMVYDHDIDARMQRTRSRMLPAGKVSRVEALVLGMLLSSAGILWAFAIYPLYGWLVLAGVFFDGLVYTVWLKRRTPFSIVWGGLAGGMPVLAGRTLALGRIDEIGLLLTLGVLLWIPVHILSFTIKYQADYERAGVPTFPAVYGVNITRGIIAASSLLAVGVMLFASAGMGLPVPLWRLAAGVGGALIALVVASVLRASKRLDFALYKGASIYMLLAMVLIILGGI